MRRGFSKHTSNVPCTLLYILSPEEGLVEVFDLREEGSAFGLDIILQPSSLDRVFHYVVIDLILEECTLVAGEKFHPRLSSLIR